MTIASSNPDITAVEAEQPATELTAPAMNTWAKLRAVQAQIKSLAEQEEMLKATLRDALGTGSFAIGGQVMFTISPQRRFDQTLAETELTDAEREACTRTVIDRDAVQKLVSPARYSACQIENGKPAIRAAK